MITPPTSLETAHILSLIEYLELKTGLDWSGLDSEEINPESDPIGAVNFYSSIPGTNQKFADFKREIGLIQVKVIMLSNDARSAQNQIWDWISFISDLIDSLAFNGYPDEPTDYQGIELFKSFKGISQSEDGKILEIERMGEDYQSSLCKATGSILCRLPIEKKSKFAFQGL